MVDFLDLFLSNITYKQRSIIWMTLPISD